MGGASVPPAMPSSSRRAPAGSSSEDEPEVADAEPSARSVSWGTCGRDVTSEWSSKAMPDDGRTGVVPALADAGAQADCSANGRRGCGSASDACSSASHGAAWVGSSGTGGADGDDSAGTEAEVVGRERCRIEPDADWPGSRCANLAGLGAIVGGACASAASVGTPGAAVLFQQSAHPRSLAAVMLDAFPDSSSPDPFRSAWQVTPPPADGRGEEARLPLPLFTTDAADATFAPAGFASTFGPGTPIVLTEGLSTVSSDVADDGEASLSSAAADDPFARADFASPFDASTATLPALAESLSTSSNDVAFNGEPGFATAAADDPFGPAGFPSTFEAAPATALMEGLSTPSSDAAGYREASFSSAAAGDHFVPAGFASEAAFEVVPEPAPAEEPHPESGGVSVSDEADWAVREDSWTGSDRGPGAAAAAEDAHSASRVQERLQRARTNGRMLSSGAAVAGGTTNLDEGVGSGLAATWSADGPCLSPLSACSGEAIAPLGSAHEDFGPESPGQLWLSAAPGGEGIEGGRRLAAEPTGRSTPSSLAKPPAPARRRSQFDAAGAPCYAAQPRAAAAAPPPPVASSAAPPPPVRVSDEPAVYGGSFEPAAFYPDLNEEKPMLGNGSDAPCSLRGGVGAHGSRSKIYSENPPSPDAATTGLLLGERDSGADSALSPDERESSYFFQDSLHTATSADALSPGGRRSPVRLRRHDHSPTPARSRSTPPFKRSTPPRRHNLDECCPLAAGAADQVTLRRRQDSFSNPDQEPPISHPFIQTLRTSLGSSASAGSTDEPERREPPRAGCSADCLSPPVASYEQELLVAVRRFNLKPRDGVAYLQQRGFLRGEAPAIAHFLRSTKGLSKRRLGDYLGERGEPNEKVLAEYVRLFHFAGLSFVGAIRAFLTPFRLPGEAQKIDRIMCEFASHYAAQNPGVFSSADTAYVLGFSVIMLNTDAHSVQIKPKNRMTKAEFVRNNRGIDSGKDLPVALLESVYDDIQNDEIRTGMSHDDMGELELLEFFKQGSCFKKFNHARLAADRYHSCRLWIAADELRYQNLAARGKKEKSIPLSLVEAVLVGPTSEVFRRNGVSSQSADALGCFSLVCGGRTLDLQASTPEELEIWTHFFQQVVERSRLEQHARRVALRGQPREAFLLSASDVWQAEILPHWEAARPQPRTRMLWWEGVPPTVRTQLWRLAIGEQAGYSYEAARAEARPVDRAAAADRVRREISIPMRGGAAPAPGVPADFNLFTAEDSPMHGALLALLAALEAAARGGGPRMGEHASLLAAALLLYLEPPAAFGCMCTLLDSHFVGKLRDRAGAGSSHALWRMRAARAALRRELPELMAHLTQLGVELEDFLPAWLSSLFLSTLALDTAARVWDCYLRDGEPLVWQVALELLRILSPALLEQTTPTAALALLHRASDAGGATEKALFGALAVGDGALHELLRTDFSQKLPMPPAERGPVFDLWRNSFEAEDDAGSRQTTGLRQADGSRAARLLSEDAGDASTMQGEPRGAYGAGAPAGGAADASRGLLGPFEKWLRGKWEYRGAAL